MPTARPATVARSAAPPATRPDAVVAHCGSGMHRLQLALIDAALAVVTCLLRVLDLAPVVGSRLRAAAATSVVAGGVALVGTGACGPFDWACKVDEWQAGWLEGLTATISGLTQSMLQGVFTSSASTISTQAWNVGILSVNRLAAVMGIVVVGLAAIQIAVTLLARQRAGVLRAVIGAALAWPVCAASVWVAIRLVAFVDALAEQIIINSTALTVLGGLVDVTWLGAAASGNAAAMALVGLFFVFFVFIPTVLLTLVMAFRNYALVVAIAVAPVALMVWGSDALRGMSRTWARLTLALILTKPVMAISVLVAGEMVAAGLAGGGIGAFLTGVVGLFTAAAAPATAMALVSGAMALGDAGASRGMEQQARGAVRVATGAASWAAFRGARGVAQRVRTADPGGAGPYSAAASAVQGTRTSLTQSVNSFLRRGSQGATPGKGAGSGSTTAARPSPGASPPPGGSGATTTAGAATVLTQAASTGGGATGGASVGSEASGSRRSGAASPAVGRRAGEATGGAAGGAAGRAAGTAAGSVVPGAGNAVGGVVGEQVGARLGANLGGAVGESSENTARSTASTTGPAASQGAETSRNGTPQTSGPKGRPPSAAAPRSGGRAAPSSPRGGADLNGGLG